MGGKEKRIKLGPGESLESTDFKGCRMLSKKLGLEFKKTQYGFLVVDKFSNTLIGFNNLLDKSDPDYQDIKHVYEFLDGYRFGLYRGRLEPEKERKKRVRL